jgi:hypothetical protein
VRLCEAYRQQYQAAAQQLSAEGDKPLQIDERAVFLKFELFAKRLTKLTDMFTTIHQFSSLEQHTHITGECFMCWRNPYCGVLYMLLFSKCRQRHQQAHLPAMPG